MDSIPQKRCSKCGEFKPATVKYFHRHKETKDGFNSSCKSCVVARSKQQYEEARNDPDKWVKRKEDAKRRLDNDPAQRERKNAKQRERRNLPEIKQADKEYARVYRQIPEVKQRNRDYRRDYYNHPDNHDRMNEAQRIQHKDWYHNKPGFRDRVLAKQKDRYHNDPMFRESAKARQKQPKHRLKKKEYRESEHGREVFRVAKLRRRARKRQLPDTFTAAEWQMCLDYHYGCCAVCGQQLKDLFGDVVAHADHWIPLASPDCPGTVAANMICLCNACNQCKSSRMPMIWLTEFLGERKAKKKLAEIQAYFEWVTNNG